MIGILDYGSGNINAIGNIYSRLNVPHCLVSKVADFEKPLSRIVLAGVGAFDHTMKLLKGTELLEPLNEIVLSRKLPTLGVCVGMQIMAKRSAEGSNSGLSWIDGEVVRMSTAGLNSKPLLPHMGWNSIEPVGAHPILEGIDMEKGFYFLHSFCFRCNDKQNVLTRTFYGESFVSSVFRDNIFGFQFHPEKSHSNGIRLLENFAKL
jgi:glutamine amidotransferase